MKRPILSGLRACLNFATDGISGSGRGDFSRGERGVGVPTASEAGEKGTGAETKRPRVVNSKQALMALTIAFILVACGVGERSEAERKYVVTFDAQDGDDVRRVVVPSGGKVAKPDDPTRGGHNFTGWSAEPSGGRTWNFEEDVVVADMTLFAGWARGEMCDAVFETYGGTPQPKPQSVVAGGKVARPAIDPEKEHYVFDDWYATADLASKFDFTAAVTDDVTIHAKWNLQVDRTGLIAALSAAIGRAEALSGEDYTPGSWGAMQAALLVARSVYDNLATAADEDIFDATQGLEDALDNLEVATPEYAEVAYAELLPAEIDGKIWAVPGEKFSATVTFRDALRNPVDVRKTITSTEIEPWLRPGTTIHFDDVAGVLQLWLGDVETGLRADITVAAAGGAFSRTFTVETATLEQLGAMFVAAVEALEDDELDFSSGDDIRRAENLWSYVAGLDDPAKTDARKKLDEIIAAYERLGVEVEYEHSGAGYVWRSAGDAVPAEMTYTPAGEFPLGTFSSRWVYDGQQEVFVQTRWVFRPDGEIERKDMRSYSESENISTPWEASSQSGTYTFDGNEVRGTLRLLLN